jgi:Cu2+-exporting ATPase
MSGPMSLLNLLQVAAQQGMLIKDGAALEQLPTIDTVVFDKTGTLTLEQPNVGNIHTFYDIDEDTILTWAAAAEYRQTHPIGRAILQAAHERELTLPIIDDAYYKVGYGIKVTFEEQAIRGAVSAL